MDWRVIRPLWVLMLLLIAVHFLPEPWRAQGIYQWDAPQQGEPWRWFSAHWIHRDSPHLIMNLMSWVLGGLLLFPVLSAKRLAWWGGLWVSLAISASLALDPAGREPFVGSSAIFYAWLVAGCLRGALQGRRRAVFGLLLLLLVLKGVLEGIGGESLGLGQWLPAGEVAVRPHLHALAWGLVWGGCASFTGKSVAGLGSRRPGGAPTESPRLSDSPRPECS